MRRAGFVLVGGRSTRMGRDKALLPGDGGTLLEDVAAKALAAAGNVALIGDPAGPRGRYSRFGFDCLPDIRPGLGPLGGIHTALKSGRGEYSLILACDMPELDRALLERLFETAESSDARCVVVRDAAQRVHPLCAVYRADCLGVVGQAQAAGRLKLMDLIEELGAIRIPCDHALRNCNTPEDWAAVARG